ncbi:MAG: PLP-dependent aminotransferase family protein [Anaerolineae bacterium]|jgi:2-aminoadipate transaminase
MSVKWDALYARRLNWMTTSVIRDILKVAQSPDIISLAGGWPEADLFPVGQFEEICSDVLNESPRESLQYGLTDGLPALRQQIADLMSEQGMSADMENIVITSGSQQALDLMGRIFLNEGDTVLVESPTFLGALQSFNAYGACYATVPLDEEGARVDLLEEIIARTRPKFMYLLPTFQNPTGVTMSLERRKKVVEIAAEMGVPILEDDPYGALRFAGDSLPTLASVDMANYPENAAQGRYAVGNVVYLSTFSKTLAPGLRIAWAVAPKEIIEQFVMAKQGADLHSNALSQAMACEFMRRGLLPAQVQRIRDTYLERRNAMCEAIAEFFPPDVRYTQPDGGLFLWVTLPEKLDGIELLKEATRHKVAFVPGAPFFVDGAGHNTMRLSFACVPPETIREGIRRLGEVIAAQLG